MGICENKVEARIKRMEKIGEEIRKTKKANKNTFLNNNEQKKVEVEKKVKPERKNWSR